VIFRSEDARVITGGVDTRAGMHVAAALDPLGGLPGVREFPATAAGYADLLSWLGGFGDVALAGVEGTGSYGAGLARYLAAARVRVAEVDRADRQDRPRAGKPDPLDAVSAARAALSGRAAGAPKGRDGAVEAIRALMVARRSARNERTQAIGQARALIVTGPDDLRARSAGLSAAAPRACSACTASARTPRRCCSPRRGITPGGCATRPPGRTCAVPPRSRPPPARPGGTGSAAAGTARLTMHCGGS
jgi:transposase